MENKTIIMGYLCVLIFGISIMAMSCMQHLSPVPAPTLQYESITALKESKINTSPIWQNSTSDTAYKYSITPNLPTGLNIDTKTGIIDGRPRHTYLETIHTITAITTLKSAPTTNLSRVYTATITIFIYVKPSKKENLITAIATEIERQDTPSPNLSGIDTSEITNMGELFKEHTDFNGDITGWDVSNVENMNAMFQGLTAFNGDITGWDVSNVENMNAMFQGATAFNQNLESWNVANTANKTDMFLDSGVTEENLPSWFPRFSYGNIRTSTHTPINTSPIWEPPASDTAYKYSISPNLPDGLTIDANTGIISGTLTTTYPSTVYTITATDGPSKYTATITILIDTHGKITPSTKDELIAAIDAEIKRQSNSPLPNLNLIDTNSITDMSELFKDNPTFNGDISRWNVSKVENMSAMFQGATAFNQDISKWNVAMVKDMTSMFNGAATFNQDISKWNVGMVRNMTSMFNGAATFNQDISKWNVGMVRNMTSMFNGAVAFNQNIGGWNVGMVRNMTSMFNGAVAFNQNIGGWNVGMVKNMTSMFQGATAFNGNIGGWEGKTSNVTNMSYMFRDTAAFNQDISKWNVGMVKNMTSMFNGATAFNGNIGGWDVSKVKNMNYMFQFASAFNQDLESWNVAEKVKKKNMFNDSGLAEENLPSWYKGKTHSKNV